MVEGSDGRMGGAEASGAVSKDDKSTAALGDIMSRLNVVLPIMCVVAYLVWQEKAKILHQAGV